MMLLTVADVCEALQCSATKVYRLVHGGHLRAYKSPGRSGTLRFSIDDLHEYLEASVVEPCVVGDG